MFNIPCQQTSFMIMVKFGLISLLSSSDQARRIDSAMEHMLQLENKKNLLGYKTTIKIYVLTRILSPSNCDN